MRTFRLQRCLLLFVLLAATAHADVAMSVRAVAGFDGFFRAGEWVPVTLSVQNLGQRFQGEVRVALRWGERFSQSNTIVSFARNLDLGSGTGALVPFVLPLNTPAIPIDISFRDEDGSAESHEVTLRSRPVRGRLVVALSRRPNLDFLLDGESVTVAYPLPGYLPADAAGYDGVSAVVVHDVDLSSVDRSRLVALEEWISTGGTLVISGGPTLLARTPGELARFLPVVPNGLTSAPSADGLVSWEKDVPILTVESLDSTTDSRVRVLARSGDHPVIVEERRGNGRVLFLAFDYAGPAADAARAAGLWSRVLNRSESPALPIDLRRRIFETPVLADLLDLPLYEFPPFLFVAAFVLAYAATIMMVLLSRKPSWTVIPTVLAIAAVFGVGANLWFNRLQQPAAALFVEYDHVVTRPGQPIAEVRKDFIVFSTQQEKYEVRLPSGVAIPLQDRDLSVRLEDDGFAVSDIDVGRWSLRNFHVSATYELPISIRAEARGPEVQVIMRNQSETPIADSYVVYRGTVAPLGAVPPAGSASVEFTPRQDAGLPDLPDATLAQAARRRVLSLEARRQSWDSTGDALVIGFLPDSPLPAEPDASFARRFRMSLLTQTVEVTR